MSWLCLAPALVVVIIFFGLPIGLLGIESFTETGTGGATFKNYTRLLASPYYLGVMGTTFWLAAVTALVCLVLGYPMALLLRRAPGRLKGLLVVCIVSPLLVSVVVRTFGWVILLGQSGLLNKVLQAIGFDGPYAHATHLFTPTVVIVGLVHIFLPFMVLAIYGALQKQGRRLNDAALSLGASPLRAFFAVTLPLSLPGIVAGLTTVFALAAGSYVTVAVLGGSKVMVLSILSYQQSIGLSNWPFGSAIGIVLLIGIVGITQLLQRLLRLLYPRALPS